MLKITAIGAHPDDIEIFFTGRWRPVEIVVMRSALLLPLTVLPGGMTRARPLPPAALVKLNAVLPDWAHRSCLIFPMADLLKPMMPPHGCVMLLQKQNLT